ncbi:3-isopropylmalate dehydratase small subunit [Thalassotalea sp. HSM 43]|uniref:3-isopropylmalate dehydratase small subunit n=1 Tax=Thalassotalea sp. HSM 43 TaxID=2552945 RepID=UPI001080DC7A|nr:3-isopropylmalate dehydratase small subunit [Thalassotalea sp. HSM 43]QBY04529.1 3-isopropylmalate dehydratase small subunit [Thalassotalea sp. HSM 43]
MQAFKTHTGIVAAIDRANVDTDAIMPKQYLKCISKTGYGDWAFDDWRYLDHGDVDIDVSTRRLNPDFELNQSKFLAASILLGGENFGCGSSREHAVWGIRDMGFKVIIAQSFADIFFNNCFNNGVLAITLEKPVMDRLFALTKQAKSVLMEVDLEHKQLRFNHKLIHFCIEPSRRFKLLNGLDNIALTLQQADNIKAFEQRHKQRHPYFFNR